MDLNQISNNVAFMYTLLLIVILLMYIAFVKKPANRRSSKNG